MVNDGRLTMDAVGGNNTKINYIDLVRTGDIVPPPDNTPPGKPTLDLASASDTGSSDTDNLTKDNTPTFTGEAEADSTVEVFADGASLARPPRAAPAVTASPSPTKPLAEGRPRSRLRRRTRLVMSSSPSEPISVTVDIGAPAVSITSGPSGIADQAPRPSAEFTAEEGSSVTCELGSNTDQSCVSPKSYTDLDDGDYTFAARRPTEPATRAARRATSPWYAWPRGAGDHEPGQRFLRHRRKSLHLRDGRGRQRHRALRGARPPCDNVDATGSTWTIDLTNVAEGAYTYAAKATKNGKTSGESAVRVTVDTTDPGAPANLTAQGQRARSRSTGTTAPPPRTSSATTSTAATARAAPTPS